MLVRSLLFRDSVFYKAGVLRVWEIPINTFEGECVLGIYGVAAINGGGLGHTLVCVEHILVRLSV